MGSEHPSFDLNSGFVVFDSTGFILNCTALTFYPVPNNPSVIMIGTSYAAKNSTSDPARVVSGQGSADNPTDNNPSDGVPNLIGRVTCLIDRNLNVFAYLAVNRRSGLVDWIAFQNPAIHRVRVVGFGKCRHSRSQNRLWN